jgi:hypothetical protein
MVLPEPKEPVLEEMLVVNGGDGKSPHLLGLPLIYVFKELW